MHEIELPLEPYDGLPVGVAEVLDKFLMPIDGSVDYIEALERLSALDLLLADWHDIVDDASAVARWCAEKRQTPWSAWRDAHGQLLRWDPADGQLPPTAVSIPPAVVSTLATVLEDPNADRRFVGIDAIETITRETELVSVDAEKLLGHLHLRHGVSYGNLAPSDDERRVQHAHLHNVAPGHPLPAYPDDQS